MFVVFFIFIFGDILNI